MKEMTIKFRCDKIDTEEVRECLEDNLGIEILEIESSCVVDDAEEHLCIGVGCCEENR